LPGLERSKVTIQITKPEVEVSLNVGLKPAPFKDAEDVILQALKSSEKGQGGSEEQRRQAIGRLNFGQTHRLSLGDITIHELRHEART
jgi:hypothetical protein